MEEYREATRITRYYYRVARYYKIVKYYNRLERLMEFSEMTRK